MLPKQNIYIYTPLLCFDSNCKYFVLLLIFKHDGIPRLKYECMFLRLYIGIAECLVVKDEETRLSAMYVGLVDCVDVLPAAVLLCVLSAWI
jgi:hypothetical protein